MNFLWMALFSAIGGVQSFVLPASRTTTTRSLRVFLSDVPKEEVDPEKPKSKRRFDEEPTWQENNRRAVSKNWRDDWLPDPPEDALTFSGDIASLFWYTFMDRVCSDIYFHSVLATTTSAADFAKTLDPMGTDIVVAATPVWLDPAALGPLLSDRVLLLDLKTKVIPHFTPALDSAGVAGVALATCWIVAGLWHKAFAFQNTISCSTERAVAVTGQTWLTASAMMILLATASTHWSGSVDVRELSTSVLMMEGRTLSPVEEWFGVLSPADADYIFGSLGVLLTWRFLISYLLGGWSKK